MLMLKIVKHFLFNTHKLLLTCWWVALIPQAALILSSSMKGLIKRIKAVNKNKALIFEQRI